MRLKERESEHGLPLTHEEARAITHCRLAWRACKLDAERVEREAVEVRTERQRKVRLLILATVPRCAPVDWADR